MESANWSRRPISEKQKSAVYQYQKDCSYFAKVPDCLKDAGAEELTELGAEDVRPEFRGIHFRADKPSLYRINYLTRILSRCLAPLISFPCHDTDRLYQKAKQIKWENFFGEGNTFAVSGNVSDSAISHSKYASLRLKDAVADYFKEKTGQRPDVSVRNPDILLDLHIRNDKAVISLDTSCGALHRRGYREETVSAPMQETVAAAIIRLSEWSGSVPLYDPLCGSGTLLCEALMRYSNIPAGIFRNKFGFEFLPDFDSTVWEQIKKEADGYIRELPKNLIGGSDISSEAVRASRTNLMGLHFGNKVIVERADIRNLPSLEGHVIVTNPPYGIRMGGNENLEMFYKNLGDFLKQKCKDSTAYVYFGERKYIKKVGLKTSWKKPIKTGGLDGRLVKYELWGRTKLTT
ncbi:rRNA (guanine-N(2)-)-methyltransferase [Candidatus Magnetomorum sp. HK-1]|nr:rRNA (guanine-N(2)-)-methyltransferase [Candidatus Magnetomorum sp. HK-1]